MAPRARRWWRAPPPAARGSCGVSDPRGRRTCDRALAYSAPIGALYRCQGKLVVSTTGVSFDGLVARRARHGAGGCGLRPDAPARKELIAAERELEEHAERVEKQRQELPWVPVENEYRFATEDGSRSFPEMFE